MMAEESGAKGQLQAPTRRVVPLGATLAVRRRPLGEAGHYLVVSSSSSSLLCDDRKIIVMSFPSKRHSIALVAR